MRETKEDFWNTKNTINEVKDIYMYIYSHVYTLYTHESTQRIGAEKYKESSMANKKNIKLEREYREWILLIGITVK